jgi:hypothetical protein
MTFKEKLTQISNTVDFELFVAEHCAKIKDAMEEAANSGYRTFQIDITQPLMGQKVLEACAVNCCTIAYTATATRNATKIVLVSKRIEDYLKQLGFAEVDRTNIQNACWLTIILKVEW